MAEFVCPLHAAALETPCAPALVSGSGVLSFRDVEVRVQATAAALRNAGLRPGGRAALTGRASSGDITLFLALLRAGVVACPVNPRFPEAYAMALLGRVGAQRLPPLPDVPSVGDAQVEAAPPRIPEDRPATIIFTSGSAGSPKAALHSYGNHCHSALQSNRNIALRPGDCWLLSLPMFHVAGIGVLFRCLVSGAAVAVPEDREPIEAAVVRYGVTHLSLVATQLHRLLQSEEGRAALRRVRAILLGGSAFPDGLVREAFALGLPIYTSYGLTEMASQVTTTRAGDPLDRLLTSGAPLSPGNLRISGDGEILVRGKTLFLGYVDGEQVMRSLTEDGWFATGDLGAQDAQGYLAVTGRRDNMFISGGENIQPEEVERSLCKCAGVCEALVVPVSHAEFGAVPAAFVRYAPGTARDEAVLQRELEKALPRFKVPRRILPWPEDLAGLGIKLGRKAFAERASVLLSG